MKLILIVPILLVASAFGQEQPSIKFVGVHDGLYLFQSGNLIVSAKCVGTTTAYSALKTLGHDAKCKLPLLPGDVRPLVTKKQKPYVDPNVASTAIRMDATGVHWLESSPSIPALSDSEFEVVNLVKVSDGPVISAH